MHASKRYTCEDALRRMDDGIDGRLPEEQAALLDAHLEGCPRCRHELEFERSFDRAVRQKLRQLQPPPGLIERIRRQVAGE